jgi:hypothetical protein
MPTKQKLMPPILCGVDGCTKPAVYSFTREIDVTNGESIARESIFDRLNCCKTHEEQVAKDFSGAGVSKVTISAPRQ